MGSRGEKDKQKQIQDKCQTVLNAMLRDEDNKYCVDCDSKGPRWASWNLGVFLCIRCAGIHRNLGVHISKVKSVNLDSWTPEQVVSLQQMGNSRARAVYEANLPDNFRRPQSDSSLESFIRAKYEHKKYIAREWVQPPAPKVDWEKEIDEEMERQKRKKKTTAAAAAERRNVKVGVEVPQIPKPRSGASPKPARSAAPPAAERDLLGLQNGEDGFSGFLSAAPGSGRDEAADAARAEEESFFNQPAPTEKERSRLTKDSILALYGSPAFQPPPPPPQYQFAGYRALPPQGQFVPAAQFAAAYQPFAGLQQPPPPAAGAAPNPFCAPPGALPQQFSGLTLASQTPAPAKPQPAANLWQ